MTRWLVLCIAIGLAGCQQARMVTRTETVEVKVEKYVPLKPEWTADTPVPTEPQRACVWTNEDGTTTPTICIGPLTDLLDAFRAALKSANDDKAAIRRVQPK